MAFANRFAHGFFCEHGPKAILGIIGDENNSKLLFHQNKVVSWLKHGLFHQNKVAKLESKTDCPALIYFEVEGGKLYCLCKPGLKTMCQDCAKAVSCVIGDKNKFQLYKIVVMEDGNSHSLSKECIKAVLHLVGDALSHHKQKDENNLMCSKLQFISQQNKTVESVPDWSGLLTDVLIDIALKLSLFEDLAAFRGVCTSWRAAGAMVKSVFKVPLLMLQEKEGDGDVRELYSLSKKKIVSRISMPEARGKRCLDVGFGWILTVATSGGELNMVKPMISSKIQLPNMKTFPEYKKYSTEPEVEFVTAAMLSEDPLETSDYMLMVCVNMNLGFWRNGDNHWSKLEAKVLIPTSLMNCFANIGYHKHKMYAFDFGMRVWMWDPYGTQAPRVILTLELKLDQVMHLPYFVESSKGELLLLFRDSVHQSGREEDEMVFWIMKIDTVNNEYKEIDTLGGDAVFVGQNKAVAVVADDFPGVIKANCIYFTDNDFEQYRSCRGIAEMGIYSVEDYNTERFGVESNSEICPAFWAFPSL